RRFHLGPRLSPDVRGPGLAGTKHFTKSLGANVLFAHPVSAVRHFCETPAATTALARATAVRSPRVPDPARRTQLSAVREAGDAGRESSVSRRDACDPIREAKNPRRAFPNRYRFRGLDREELLAHYRACEIAFLTPLKDGMNLVAKEYCACRVDEDGALILSQFAGAAEQLKPDALLVNPYDVEQMADTIVKAF